MGRNYCLIDIRHVIHKIGYLRAVFARQAVTRSVGNIYHRSSRIDNGLYHTREVFLFGTAGVFGVKFHIVHKSTRILNRLYGTFDYILRVGVQFFVNMILRSAYAGVYSPAAGVL